MKMTKQITDYVNEILSEPNLKKMRDAIAYAILLAYQDGTKSGNANMEVSQARGRFDSLSGHIDHIVSMIRDRISKGQVTMADLTQEVKEALTGGAVAVVGDDSVITSNITDKAVTYEKTNFEDEIAFRVKNLSKAGNIKDSNNDGIADGFVKHGDNVVNPQVVNNEQRWTSLNTGFSGSMSNYDSSVTLVAGHHYYISFSHRNVGAVNVGVNLSHQIKVSSDGKFSAIHTRTANDDYRLRFASRSANVDVSVRDIIVVDLTERFGAGKEPDLYYFEFLLSLNEYNSWFDYANLTNARTNAIKTAKDLVVYDTKGELRGNVNDVLMNLDDRFVKAKFIENQHDPKKAIAGRIADNGIGYPQTVIDSGDGFTTQQINVVGETDIIMRGVRLYSFTDKNNNIIDGSNTIELPNETTSLTIPEQANWMWVSIRPATSPRIEFGDVLHTFDEYGNIEGLYVNGQKVDGFSSSGDKKKELYELAKAKLEIADYDVVNAIYKTNAIIANQASVPDSFSSQVVNLNSNERQKLILHLHTREDDGNDSENDVFLPNAKPDFSDIRITDNNGNALQYHTAFKTDKFDIVGDYRLGTRGRYNHTYLENSKGEIITVHEGRIRKSTDGGKTWSTLVGLASFWNVRLNLVTQDDTLFFNKDGMLYRSAYPYDTYEENYDLTEYHADTLIQAGAGMVQHPDGEIFFGAYQVAKHIILYKSVDNGDTWQEIYNIEGGYQHVHAMYIDTNQTPPVIYAGLDQGGGILKSTDKGQSWIDLKALYNPPQSTDFGVTYAGDGYRLLGGETSIVGGHSIIKTKDDQNFYPVLSDIAGVSRVERLGNTLFGGGAGTNGLRAGVIYVSKDEGETWEQAYSTGHLNDSSGANDGFRHLSKVGSKIIAVNQSSSRPPLHIYPDGNYAEIIVDVPEGATSITVESGHAYPNEAPIYNDSGYSGEKLVHFELNENAKVIKELVSGEIFEGNFEWAEDGKRLSHFYPRIIQPSESHAILIRSLPGFEVSSNGFDTSNGITISFWATMSSNSKFKVFENDSGDVLDCSGSTMSFNGEAVAYPNMPHTDVNFLKYDITVDSLGEVVVYTNGNRRTYTNGNGSQVLNALSKSGTFTFLENISATLDRHKIQHFMIRKGVLSQESIASEFHAGIRDNFEVS